MSRRASRRARYLAGFDTEDDGKGNPFLWCFTHESGSYWTDNRDAALEYIATLAATCKARKRTLELWATNLEYDLCNLFPPERIAEVSFRFGRSALCGASWRGCEFRDTMRHVPASVAQLGEMVGAKKREASLFQRDKKSRTHARYLARCMRDATITYRAAKHFHASYKELGQRPRMTLASTALAIWRDKYWGREVRRPMQYVWEAALEAYHGGRTQAFAVGTFPKVQVADVSSMYPWAMVNAPLPLPWGMVRFVGRDADVRAAALYDVTVDSALSIPRLPVRTSEGTAFPNGRWRGWYVGEELLAFVRAGGRLRVNRGIEFLEQCEPFKGYVASMFRRKQASRGMSRTVYKLLLNSLYGKFGQQGRQVRCMELSEFMALEHAPHDWRYWNGLAIFSEDGPPDRKSVV